MVVQFSSKNRTRHPNGQITVARIVGVLGTDKEYTDNEVNQIPTFIHLIIKCHTFNYQ